MRKTIITGIIGILLIGSVLAMYSGETDYYPLTSENQVITSLNYTIVNNAYNLDGLNISWNATGIIISTSPYYKSDNFSILINFSGYTFEPQTITIDHFVGGGYYVPKPETKPQPNLTFPNNTLNNTSNITCNIGENCTNSQNSVMTLKQFISRIYWASGIIILTLVIYFIYKIKRKKNEKEK